MRELPRITNDDDWLDIKDGEHGIVLGTVQSVNRDHLTVRFADWSCLMIDADGLFAIPLRPAPGMSIEIEVERHEDGVRTTPQALKNARITT